MKGKNQNVANIISHEIQRKQVAFEKRVDIYDSWVASLGQAESGNMYISKWVKSDPVKSSCARMHPPLLYKRLALGIQVKYQRIWPPNSL